MKQSCMHAVRAKNDYLVYAGAQRHEMLRFVPGRARTALGVGCSTGNFAEILKTTRGCKVWGVAADAEAAAIAGGRLDRVVNAPFGPGLDLAGAKFECVVFNDVLEHMVDPYSALGAAKELLTEEGCVVASIPNVRYFTN